MIIAIGSKNKVKVEALEETLKTYPMFSKAKIISVDANSEISNQPLSLSETIQGAKNRAKNAFKNSNCSYSFGIESGLMQVLESNSGYMEVAICSIFDGRNFSLGQSCSFELPQRLIDLMLNQKLSLQEACFNLKLTNNPKLGEAEGAIGVLTQGRILRKDYTKQAIITALIQLENSDLYAPAVIK
ncbi:MAG: inosine/xanthosine triphosphatase [Chlamydiae bacterium]|nr:inosine/xanthosine triphosphatase [Chlamydiota bacterium]